jgi:hypothetical protein
MRVLRSRFVEHILVLACLAVCFALPVPASAMTWSVAVEPGVAFGLGIDARYFPVGYYTTIRGAGGGEDPLALAGTIEANYELKPLLIDTALSLVGAGPGVALRLPLFPSISLRASGAGGYCYGLLNPSFPPELYLHGR